MKIALASDIHLEFDDLIIKNTSNADVLVLAGDIVIAEDLHDHPAPLVPYTTQELKKLGKRQLTANRYREFISRCSFEFPHVVVIAGNHEFYHGRWNGSLDHLYGEYSKYSNVHFLEDGKFEFKDVLFIGSTLWTDLNKADPVTIEYIRTTMNDYNLIRDDSAGFCKLRPSKTIARHRRSLEYIDRTVSENTDKRIVVVSHMAPSSLSIESKYKGSIDNAAYYSDLSNFILDKPQITLWCHGHMHSHHDYMLGDTRVLCHPRGYVGYERGTQDIDPYWPTIVEV